MDDTTFEPHFTVQEIADQWKLGREKVRLLFHKEPGVVVITSHCLTGKKRKYATYRIPESVVRRVHTRMQNVAPGGAGLAPAPLGKEKGQIRNGLVAIRKPFGA